MLHIKDLIFVNHVIKLLLTDCKHKNLQEISGSEFRKRYYQKILLMLEGLHKNIYFKTNYLQ